MYHRINRWVHTEELIAEGIIETGGQIDAKVHNRVWRIRKAIEDDHKTPRYLLNSRQGEYMLHSKFYPEGDSPLRFEDVIRGRRE